LIAEYLHDEEPSSTRAPYPANYALYHWPDPPDGEYVRLDAPEPHVEPVCVRALHEGECVGFGKDKEGHLCAQAGKEEIPLENGRYCWHITPETEYTAAESLAHTGKTVGKAMLNGVVELPVGLALLPFAILYCMPRPPM
jgi:hypothetical protein